MKAASVAALWLFATAACAHVPVVSPDYSGYFETLDNALYYSLAQAMRLSAQYEHGGIVVRYKGMYYASPPVHSGSDRGVSFEQKYRGELVATYHTHLCIGDFQAKFSPVDIQNAVAAAVPSYLGIVCTGEFRMFDPGTMQASTHRRDRGTSEGLRLNVTFENALAFAGMKKIPPQVPAKG